MWTFPTLLVLPNFPPLFLPPVTAREWITPDNHRHRSLLNNVNDAERSNASEALERLEWWMNKLVGQEWS